MNVGVIGGGVSGIRAALTLARSGAQVTLLEKNRHLGGRVFSYQTPEFGEVDIGQHIWLRCCTGFEQLMEDLAVPEEWIYRQDRVSMPYRWPDGFAQTLSAGRLPGNLSLLPLLFRARLSFIHKLKYCWGVLRASFYSEKTVEKLDNVSMAEWLRARGQPEAVVKLFWEPFVVGVCNGRLEEVSARYAIFAARESLFKSAKASAICLLRKPLSEVLDRRAQQVLTEAGADVQTGANVREVIPGRSVTVRTRNGEMTFDRAILALPLKRMHDVLPNAQLPEPPEVGAIAGLLLHFAGPVMDELFFTGVSSPVQVVFNKTAIRQDQTEDNSQVIEIVLSAAEREVRLGAERLMEEMMPELAKLLPRVADTPLLKSKMLVHAQATFRVSPGGDNGRLEAIQPELENVLLAGDYVKTGWPSTMESAVRAGLSAAELALGNGST